jgi:ankyrin repeat protein
VDLERHRKDAKALVRAFNAANPEAVERAQAVLGKRAHERFQLSDAQHVVAVEHGYRTWPELKHAADQAERGRREGAPDVLAALGADPEAAPRKGLTHLETALYHGAREAAETIAAHAISPLALWTVAALGRVDLLPSFLDSDGRLRPEAGAHRPNLSDVGWTPAAPPAADNQTILDEALGHAAHNGRDEAVIWLLDHGADVDGRPYLDVTPLHFAVQFGHTSTVRLLVERGADLNIRERIHDGTPLDWAKRSAREDIVSLLDRTEETVDAGREYLPGDPVVLRVVRRRSLWVDDQGGAVARAGKPAGWREAAERIADELIVNVSRNGTVSLPVSRRGPGYDAIVRRIAEASVALHEELLELE